jgi:hypothetical protein
MAKRAKLRAWTKDDVRELKTLARQKTPAAKIAKSLKRTLRATQLDAARLANAQREPVRILPSADGAGKQLVETSSPTNAPSCKEGSASSQNAQQAQRRGFWRHRQSWKNTKPLSGKSSGRRAHSGSTARCSITRSSSRSGRRGWRAKPFLGVAHPSHRVSMCQ